MVGGRPGEEAQLSRLVEFASRQPLASFARPFFFVASCSLLSSIIGLVRPLNG